MLGKNKETEETWKRIPKNSVGVELGVWRGDTSEKFLRRAKHLHLVDTWSVVPYEQSDEFGNYEGYLRRYSKLVGSQDPKDFQKYYDKIAKSVAARFCGKSVTIHRCTTTEFFNEFKDKVDWVYVDALHSFEGCLSDLRNSINILKPEGIIFGDDYGNKEGVVQAVNAFLAETGLKLNNFHATQFEIRLKCTHQA